MPFPEFGKKRGLVRPNVKAQIDWSHPYASALAGAWALGGLAGNTGVFIDELTGKFAPKITLGAGTLVEFAYADIVGPSVRSVKGNSSTVHYSTNCLASGLTSGVSTISVGMTPDAHTGSYYPFIFGSNAGGGGNGFITGYGQYPSGQKANFESVSGGGALGMWLDGIKQTAANLSNANLPFMKWFCLGNTCSPTLHGYTNVKLLRPPDNPTFVNLDNSLVSFIAIFNTVLPDAAMAELTLNPYNLLTFPNQFDMPILQAGPSFISGWSRQSNLPVIGGGTF